MMGVVCIVGICISWFIGSGFQRNDKHQSGWSIQYLAYDTFRICLYSSHCTSPVTYCMLCGHSLLVQPNACYILYVMWTVYWSNLMPVTYCMLCGHSVTCCMLCGHSLLVHPLPNSCSIIAYNLAHYIHHKIPNVSSAKESPFSKIPHPYYNSYHHDHWILLTI